MLTTEEFRDQIKIWFKQEKYELVRASSTKRIHAKGYVDLGLSSFMRWIEPEWLEEAKRRGVVTLDKKGNWIPIVGVREEETVTGHRGKYAITETKTKLDKSNFEKFMQDYKEFSEKKRSKEIFDQKIQEENKQFIKQLTI